MRAALQGGGGGGAGRSGPGRGLHVPCTHQSSLFSCGVWGWGVGDGTGTLRLALERPVGKLTMPISLSRLCTRACAAVVSVPADARAPPPVLTPKLTRAATPIPQPTRVPKPTPTPTLRQFDNCADDANAHADDTNPGAGADARPSVGDGIAAAASSAASPSDPRCSESADVDRVWRDLAKELRAQGQARRQTSVRGPEKDGSRQRRG